MRVCLDFQPATAQQAGVGRYTQLLARHLPAAAGADELVLCYFDFRRNGRVSAPPGAGLKAVHWCPGRLAQAAWKIIGWPPYDAFSGPAEVFHFPNFILPPCRSGKTVVTIHDVSFLRHPDYAEERNCAYLTSRIRDTIARADAIVTDSEFSAREICDLLAVAPDRVRVIPLAISDEFTPPNADAVEQFRRENQLDAPYLLCVGTIEPRKNHAFLLDVFEKLSRYDGRLVIAGMPGWKYGPIFERFEKSPRADRITYLRYVAPRDLPALYSGADLFLFPSHYEGFGLPPLEAMACETPVVASTAASLPEVLGNAALLMDTGDSDQWASEIQSLLESAERRAVLIDAGRKQVARFSWATTAQRTWDVYREVVA